MTPEQNAELVAAIVKAVPEIANSEDHPDQITDEGRCVRCGWQMFRSDSQGLPCCRPITLDDICLALMSVNEFHIPNIERLFTHYIFGNPLEKQDETVISLLHSWLCKAE